MSTLPLQFLILTVAGWVNRNQQDVIEYLREENRILREHVGGRRPRFQENPNWGYTRIRGALHNLGHEIGRNTIKRILATNGIEQASIRRKGMSWEVFLKLHWGAIAAADFFTVEVLTRVGLIRFLVFFVIDLRSRQVRIAGIAPDPSGRWMTQMARNLTDAEEGFLYGTRYLIHDRDPLFTMEFQEILKSSGVEAVKLPAQSPDLNAYAERFVRSIREECLSRVVPLGERHLRWVVSEYVRHYHMERNHQGLGNELIEPMGEPGLGGVTCRERLGASCGTTIGMQLDVGWVLARYGHGRRGRPKVPKEIRDLIRQMSIVARPSDLPDTPGSIDLSLDRFRTLVRYTL